jgi:anaerobic ribonucleoside-triphosphate reductase
MQKQILKQRINEVESRKNPSIYTRIVGYYRPLENFNVSKKSEFVDRTLYNV